MDPRTLLYMTIAVLVGIVLLLAINFTSIFEAGEPEHYLSRVEVRGINLIKDGKEYPLNYEQQSSMINLINKSIPIDKKASEEQGTPVNISKIIVLRFQESPIEITPIKYIGGHLIFSEPKWNSGGLLRDVSDGTLKSLIEQLTSVKLAEPPAVTKSPAAASLPVGIAAKKYLEANQVLSIKLVGFDRTEQELNQDNQTAMITFLNKAVPVDKEAILKKATKAKVDKIVIQRIGDKAIDITVIGYAGHNVIFYEPNWNPNGLMLDQTDGPLKTLLEQYF